MRGRGGRLTWGRCAAVERREDTLHAVEGRARGGVVVKSAHFLQQQQQHQLAAT